MRPLLVLLLVSSLLLPSTPDANGQIDPELGITFGLNVTTLDAPTEGDLRQMAAGGLIATWPLTGPLALESQLVLNQKGTVVNGADGRIRYGAGYLDLPLHLRVDGPSLRSLIPHLTIGGFGGLKLFEQQRAGGEFRFPLGGAPAFFKRINAGLSGSLGGMLPIGGGRQLMLSLYYQHGLLDVARAVDDQPYENAPFPMTAHTRTWSVRVRFGL